MKVLIISTYSYHGAGAAARRLHQSLLAEGVESDFLCLSDQGLSVPRLHVFERAPASLPQKVVRRMRNALNFRERRIAEMLSNANYEAYSTPRSGFSVENHPLIQQADIINLHYVSGFVGFEAFFGQVDTPIVWTLHDMNPFMGCFHYEADLVHNRAAFEKLDAQYRQEKRRAYRSANLKAVTAPSRWMTSASADSDLLGNVPHYHIPNGLDTDVFRPFDMRMARDVFHLPQDRKVVLFIGTNVDNLRKGFDLLTADFDPSSRPEVCLAAVGEVPSNKLPGVKYLGPIGDERLMALAYSAADVLAMPSREDNFPNVMIESLACGTPVVATPVGGMLDAIENGVNGFLADTLSSKDLWLAIDSALDLFAGDAVRREAICAQAVSEYNLGIQAKRFTKLYRHLAEAGTEPSELRVG